MLFIHIHRSRDYISILRFVFFFVLLTGCCSAQLTFDINLSNLLKNLPLSHLPAMFSIQLEQKKKKLKKKRDLFSIPVIELPDGDIRRVKPYRS